MAYTTIDDPTAHFQAKQYTGNGSSGHAITFDGTSNMQPDWLWNKVVSASDSHAWFDSTRGVNKILFCNNTLAEATDGNGNIGSFDSNGFTVGGNQYYANNSGATQMTWAWKANGGTTSSNSDGNITSTVQANTTAGFSIVTWTADGGGSKAVGHGLGAIPKMIITKNRTDNSTNWQIYHGANTSDPETEVIYFTNAATQDYDGFMADTAPTSSTFRVGGDGSMNGTSGKNIIAYCFAEIKGYSRFGSYKGNGGATHGTFVYTGFRPAFLIIKGSDSGNREWFIFDNKRDVINPVDTYVKAESSDANANSNFADFGANGFKIRSEGASYNSDGGDFIYMAFAEHPFVSSEGVPKTAG